MLCDTIRCIVLPRVTLLGALQGDEVLYHEHDNSSESLTGAKDWQPCLPQGADVHPDESLASEFVNERILEAHHVKHILSEQAHELKVPKFCGPSISGCVASIQDETGYMYFPTRYKSPQPHNNVNSSHRPHIDEPLTGALLAWSTSRDCFFTKKSAKAIAVDERPSWNISTKCMASDQPPLTWDPVNYPYKCEYTSFLHDGDMRALPFSSKRAGSPGDKENAWKLRMISRIPNMQRTKPVQVGDDQAACKAASWLLEPELRSSGRDSGNFSMISSQNDTAHQHANYSDTHKIYSTQCAEQKKLKLVDSASTCARNEQKPDKPILHFNSITKPFKKKRLPYTKQKQTALRCSLTGWVGQLDVLRVCKWLQLTQIIPYTPETLRMCYLCY